MITVLAFPFNVAAENTYLLLNGQKQAALVDPGFYSPEEQKFFFDTVTARGITITQLLLTHAHLDHVCGLKAAAAQYQLTPKMHRADLPVLENAPEAALRWGMPFEGYDGPLDFIAEETQILIGDDMLQVLHVPGHAPGHLCFYDAAGKQLIAGDTLFRQSIGRTDFPLCDHALLLKSIREKLYTLPDDTEVFPGHGRTTTIGYEKRNNPFCPAE